MLRNQDITSRKASFNDLEATFHDPFCSATGSDELDAGAIGSRIDGPEVVGVGVGVGGPEGGAGIGGGIRGGFGAGGLGESGDSLTVEVPNSVMVS